MSKSIKKAEEVAMNAEGGGQMDTQQCLEIQDFVLSSPQSSSRIVADEANSATAINRNLADDIAAHLNTALQARQHHVPDALPDNNPVVPSDNDQPRKTYRRERDSHDKLLRDVDAEGNAFHRNTPNFEKKLQELKGAIMDDSQVSTLTPTQANSDSLYLAYDIQNSPREQNPSTAEEEAARDNNDEEEDGGRRMLASKHQSAVTDSTAHTYGDNDTGAVNFEFVHHSDHEEKNINDVSDDPAAISEEEYSQDDEKRSQDASFRDTSLRGPEHEMPFEPETPAVPVNPFAHRGSVLKGHEMFGATQPSSIGRHLVSPSSSRPSPELYHNSSPPKIVETSPLKGYDGQAPLQSSVQIMLRSQSMESPTKYIGNSTNEVLRTFSRSFGRREPRDTYISSKESQEWRKRKRKTTVPQETSDSESDSDTERRWAEEKRASNIEKQLAQVTSRSWRAKEKEIEVPSTGRRRSVQEDSIAQCEGNDARDTQTQDDAVDIQEDQVIIDSQIQDHMSLSNQAGSSLPLQEISSNRDNDPRTPAKSQFVLDSAIPNTIAETSPLADIRPMAEIANLDDISVNYDSMIEDVPGFTQDADFDDAMRPLSPPPAILSRPRDKFPSFDESSTLQLALKTGGNADNDGDGTVAETTENDHIEKDQIPSLKQASTSQPATETHQNITDNDEGGTIGETIENDQPEKYPLISLGQFSTSQPATENHGHANKDADEDEEIGETAEVIDLNPDEVIKTPVQNDPTRGGLRSKQQIKGPSKALRSEEIKTPQQTRQQLPSLAKSTSSSTLSTPLSSLSATPTFTQRSSARIRVAKTADITLSPTKKKPNLQPKRRAPAQVVAKDIDLPVPVFPPARRASKRKSGFGSEPAASRSKQILTTPASRASSDDPLVFPVPALKPIVRSLFKDMIFAVSYVKHEKEKTDILSLISDHGGRILGEGFDKLFESPNKSRTKVNEELILSNIAKSAGFVALIADGHSRRAKFVQALALGLPCLSGHWITTCIKKGEVVDWTPYLLCAGQSSVLGNAIRSRVLSPYSAAQAVFADTFAAREKLLDGKSIVLVTGTGKSEETRRAYVFLTRVLGPKHLVQVADHHQARKKLLEDGSWDLLYVNKNEAAAETAVFGTLPAAPKKRKRVSTAADDSPGLRPKKIRIISDETVVQSLIFGQLLEE